MKSMDLLKYLDKAAPQYIEEASDHNLLLYRKRRNRTRATLAACLTLVVLAGVFLVRPALYAWENRNTVASWQGNGGFVYIGFGESDGKPSPSVYISAEMPGQKKFAAETPFTLSVGMGQVSDYEYATLSVKAHGFEITDKDGNTVTDRYVRTLSDFDSGDYGMLYRNDKPSSPVTGCRYLEDFTFRFVGSEHTTGWGIIEFSLTSHNESSTMGDIVTVYYTLQNGVLKLTDKNPVRGGSQNGSLGAILEETETAPSQAKTVELSHEGYTVTVSVTTPFLARGEAWQEKIDISGLPLLPYFMVALYPKAPTEGRAIFLALPGTFSSVPDFTIPTDAALGSYDLVVTWCGNYTGSEEECPEWVFEDFVTVTEPGTVTLSKEDFSIRVDMPMGALTPGEFLGDKFHITAFYIPTQKDYPTDGFTAELICAESLRQEDFSFVIKKPVELDPNGDFVLALSPRVPGDAPIGSYDLRITDPATGYVWIFENAALVLPVGIPAYEDFAFEPDPVPESLCRGDYWPGRGWSAFYLTLNGEDIAYQCRAELEYRGEPGGERYAITLMESATSSYSTPPFITVDAPVGMYDLVVTHMLYGYTWRAENYMEILENPEAERFGLYHNLGDHLRVSLSSGETYTVITKLENRGDPITVTVDANHPIPRAELTKEPGDATPENVLFLTPTGLYEEPYEHVLRTGSTVTLSYEILPNPDAICGLYDLTLSYGDYTVTYEDVVEVVP